MLNETYVHKYESDNAKLYLGVDKLWEKTSNDLTVALESEGISPSRVSKRVHSGRGVFLVEFDSNVDVVSLYKVITEGSEEEEDVDNDTGSSIDENETPDEGDVFEVNESTPARIHSDSSGDTIDIKVGDKISFSGNTSENVFVFDVKSGKHEGKTISFSVDEWNNIRPELEELGNIEDHPESGEEGHTEGGENEHPDEGDEVHDDQDEDDGKETSKKDDKEGEGKRISLDAFMRVTRSFPDFPNRDDLYDYLTDAGKELHDKPPPENPDEGGGGGGGFGGF